MKPFNYARLAGWSYLAVALLALFAEMLVRQKLMVRGDAAATAANILAHETLFRFGFLADTLMLIADLVLAVAFYRLFRPVSADLALFALILNAVRVPAMAANLAHHSGVIVILHDDAYTTAAREAAVSTLLQAHNLGSAATSIFFGAWCFTIGLLAWRSTFLPKFIAVMIMLALPAYWSDLFFAVMAPSLREPMKVVTLNIAGLGELAVCLWLVARSSTVHTGWLRRLQTTSSDICLSPQDRT